MEWMELIDVNHPDSLLLFTVTKEWELGLFGYGGEVSVNRLGECLQNPKSKQTPNGLKEIVCWLTC
jgi:hypothetical protein